MAGNFLTRNLVKYWMLIFDVDVSFAKFVKKKKNVEIFNLDIIFI